MNIITFLFEKNILQLDRGIMVTHALEHSAGDKLYESFNDF